MGGYLPILSKLNSISDRKGRQKQECPGMKPCDKLSCTLSGTKMSRGVSTYTRRELETDGLFKPFSKKKVVHAKSEDCAHGRMGTSLMGCIIDPKRSSNIKSRFPWAKWQDDRLVHKISNASLPGMGLSGAFLPPNGGD